MAWSPVGLFIKQQTAFLEGFEPRPVDKRRPAVETWPGALGLIPTIAW